MAPLRRIPSLFFAVRSPGDRRVSRHLAETDKNAAKFPPIKTIAEHILTNSQAQALTGEPWRLPSFSMPASS
jgi:hypothetical protein